MKNKLVVELIAVAKLVPNPKNARKHSKDQIDKLAGIITEIGWTNPILVDGNNILAGHGRRLAALQLGLVEVPSIDLSHLTEDQKRAYIIADNKIGEESTWDKEILALELADLKLDGLDMQLVAFDVAELEKLISPPAEKPASDQSPKKMTFVLHSDQVEQVKKALDMANNIGEYTDSLNKNKQGNALARICELFISQNAATQEA
jgi:ParB-like chromosome segregation protein Spo0J